MKHHCLKILPEYFLAVERGVKTFEVRYNDRDYQIGDILVLQEWFDGVYSGKEIRVKVTYILDDKEFCKEGYVIMGFRN